MMIALVSLLFGAAFTIAVCLAAGRLLVRGLRLELYRGEEDALAFPVGAASLSLLVFAFAALRLAYAGVFLALGGIIIGIAVWKGAHRRVGKPLPPLPLLWKVLFGLGLSTFGVFYLVNAMAPEMSPDGAGYHLGLVSRYLSAHGMYRITTNMYSNLSQGTELLYLFAFAFGRHSAAALVHFAFLVALPFGMLCYGRRFGFAGPGAAGALFVFFSPVAGYDGTTAYIDVAVACVLFALFYLLQIWSEQPRLALLVPIGMLAGFNYAMKYTAALAIPYALGLVAWKLLRKRQNPAKALAVTAACVLVMAGPWMARNWIWFDNPFSPFYNRFFPNPYVRISFEQEYRAQLEHWGEVNSLAEVPREATVRGGRLQGLLGPLFLLAPVALLGLRYAAGRQLLLAAAVFLVPYPANIGTRFLIPMLPFLSLAMALAIRNWKGAAVALVVFHALTCWPGTLKLWAKESVLRLDTFPLRAALRIESEEDFLKRRMGNYEVARMIEEKVPPDGRVLCQSGPPESYTSRDILVGYEGAFNSNLIDLLWAPLTSDWMPTRRLNFRFPRQPVRQVRIVQTTPRGTQQWSVSEVRLFRGDEELPREPQWRLRAHPNPWDVQLAFDNNPLTRWRSWQQISAGMEMEIDLGRAETVDRVTVDASPDQPAVKLALEGRGEDGPWRQIAPPPEERGIAAPSQARRLAALEIKWQGVDYLLIADGDMVAKDVRQNPKLWGVTLIDERAGSRLYRIE
jgi:hypothetical protein